MMVLGATMYTKNGRYIEMLHILWPFLYGQPLLYSWLFLLYTLFFQATFSLLLLKKKKYFFLLTRVHHPGSIYRDPLLALQQTPIFMVVAISFIM